MKFNIIKLFIPLYTLINFKIYALVFPASSTIGIFAAIAIPLDLSNRNVFVSYNFEANYNLPYQGSDIIPGPLQRIETKRMVNQEANEKNTFNSLKLFSSRVRLYYILNSFLERFSNGTNDCLKDLICSLNYSNASQNNGVLGSILQLIVSPSSSHHESTIDKNLYILERNGKGFSCRSHGEKCQLDFIKVFKNA